MANLILDEWLWSDLAGDNSTPAQQETFAFIKTILKKCDKIVTVKGSKFERKTFEFWKHTDVTRRAITRYYRSYFWYNSDKSINLEESSLPPLPTQIAATIKDDDHYLIQAYLATKADVIVTTDNPLRATLLKNNIKCELRNQFVPSYIASS